MLRRRTEGDRSRTQGTSLDALPLRTARMGQSCIFPWLLFVHTCFSGQVGDTGSRIWLLNKMDFAVLTAFCNSQVCCQKKGRGSQPAIPPFGGQFQTQRGAERKCKNKRDPNPMKVRFIAKDPRVYGSIRWQRSRCACSTSRVRKAKIGRNSRIGVWSVCDVDYLPHGLYN
ncbi:uncharacterized protein EV422DRAFT_416346 [Fimicolochytrium jonesii]|uniref:uncharacterized protein n=1 Tax=Fimicolochytrium jonesii TaxID=1396493 RepID=UPI0022FF0536|nr:uncharacterized protein EV422DRAFT_416346 [Fimicolochytrium jonesii]KAI8822076.1 hypothetical protein EV422DRAFT_416346 [Fimicolochytrium jonesii]